jgi:hypothetical protein
MAADAPTETPEGSEGRGWSEQRDGTAKRTYGALRRGGSPKIYERK